MNRLKNKTALITGGNSGIGAATALLFAREGASVVIMDRHIDNAPQLVRQTEQMGAALLALEGDVTKLEDCTAAVEYTVQKLGRIDILVNCAGVLDYNRSILNTSDELWDKTIAINQTGVFYLCREALKHMERQGCGSIVNISSAAAICSNSGASYTSSKYAVMGLSKNIAIQYAGTGIRCNVVCPGRTATPMNSDMEYFKQMDHDFMDICGRHMPRLPEKLPAEAQADAILFFASDDSRYCSGQWLLVDWGGSKHM